LAKTVTNNMAKVWKSEEQHWTESETGNSPHLECGINACETWTIRKQEEKMIEALEMYIWRRIMRVGWTERKTNEWVREQVGVSKERSVLAEVRKRKIRKYGHWKRRGESMVLESIERETDGKREKKEDKGWNGWKTSLLRKEGWSRLMEMPGEGLRPHRGL